MHISVYSNLADITTTKTKRNQTSNIYTENAYQKTKAFTTTQFRNFKRAQTFVQTHISTPYVSGLLCTQKHYSPLTFAVSVAHCSFARCIQCDAALSMSTWTDMCVYI